MSNPNSITRYPLRLRRCEAWEKPLKDLEQRVRVYDGLWDVKFKVGDDFSEADRVTGPISDAIKHVKVKAEELERNDLKVSEAFDDLERLIAVMKNLQFGPSFGEEDFKSIDVAVDAIIVQSLKGSES